MTERKTVPGISRQNRLSDEGLRRLEKQLISGSKMSGQVKGARFELFFGT